MCQSIANYDVCVVRGMGMVMWRRWRVDWESDGGGAREWGKCSDFEIFWCDVIFCGVSNIIIVPYFTYRKWGFRG